MRQLLPVLCQLAMALLCTFSNARSQDLERLNGRAARTNNPMRTIDRASAKMQRLLARENSTYLKVLGMQEKRLARKLAEKDSSASIALTRQIDRINNSFYTTGSTRAALVPRLDSLVTTLSFLQLQPGLASKLAFQPAATRKSLNNLEALQKELDQTALVAGMVENHERLLRETLGRYGMIKELRMVQSRLYYYRARVEGYRQIIKDPSRFEQEAVRALQQLPAFRQFFNEHSTMTHLFRVGESSALDTGQGLPGLQTRASVAALVDQRFGDSNAIVAKAGSTGSASAALPGLKHVLKSPAQGDDLSMPVFTPNPAKTTRGNQRIETGINIQQVKANHFFPSATDIGVSVGYKLNKRSLAGIGASYKVGWGKDLRHIEVSHQGIGLRSFFDYKLKGGFWLTGGAEMNHRSAFNDFEVLRNYSQWQKSGLVGMSKKYAVNQKFNGNAQLLYDVLWRRQVPRTQPLIFRVGYNLRK